MRVSPTLCSISDPAALKIVYGGRFLKSKRRYRGNLKSIAGTEHALVLNDPRDAKARRAVLLPLFQRSNLEGFSDELQHFTAQLLDQMAIEQRALGKVDVFRWLRLMAFDVIGM